MNKKILVALAAEIKAQRQAASDFRKMDNLPMADQCETRAAGMEDLILVVAPQFNPNFDSTRFVEASRL